MAFANKILLVITGILLPNSCSRTTSETEDVAIETSTLLRLKSQNGINFLESINTDNIQLFYKKDGILSPLTQNGDYPKSYILVQEPPLNEKTIKVFCYFGGTNNQEETYIKWNDSDIDTLSYDITRYETGSISIHSVKYNNKPISNNNEYGIYDIIK